MEGSQWARNWISLVSPNPFNNLEQLLIWLRDLSSYRPGLQLRQPDLTGYDLLVSSVPSWALTGLHLLGVQRRDVRPS